MYGQVTGLAMALKGGGIPTHGLGQIAQ